MEKLLSAEVWGYRKQIQFTWQRSDGNSLLVTFLEFSAKLALFKEMKECWVNRKWAFFQTYCPTQKMFHQQNVNWIRIQNILFHDWIQILFDLSVHRGENCKVWVAKVRARTHKCDVRSHLWVCVWNPFWKVCGMCVRAARFWACDVRPYFFTLLEQNCHKIVWKSILEHLIPF